MKVTLDSRAAQPSDPGATPDMLAVRVYASVGRDYQARGVFPQLWPPVSNGFTFDSHATATYNVPRAFALEVLADAKTQHERAFAKGTRGTKKAYLHLIDAIERSLDPEKWARLDAEAAAEKERKRLKYCAEHEVQRAAEAREALADLAGIGVDDSPPSDRDDGLWNDPGALAMEFRMRESPAQFKVGQAVRYWAPFLNNRNDGAEMEIVEGYGLHRVSEETGQFVKENGARVSWRWGYIAEARGGGRYFYPAYQIQSLDYERHLRLVVSTKPEDVRRDA